MGQIHQEENKVTGRPHYGIVPLAWGCQKIPSSTSRQKSTRLVSVILLVELAHSWSIGDLRPGSRRICGESLGKSVLVMGVEWAGATAEAARRRMATTDAYIVTA